MTAMQATKERWCRLRLIALPVKSRSVAAAGQAKAQEYFEHSLTIARAQHAKSWEVRRPQPGAALELSGQTKMDVDLLAPI